MRIFFRKGLNGVAVTRYLGYLEDTSGQYLTGVDGKFMHASSGNLKFIQFEMYLDI